MAKDNTFFPESVLLLRQLPENLFENIPTLVKIQQPESFFVQMRRIARLTTREMRRRSVELFLKESDSRDRASLADVERFAARWTGGGVDCAAVCGCGEG